MSAAVIIGVDLASGPDFSIARIVNCDGSVTVMSSEPRDTFSLTACPNVLEIYDFPKARNRHEKRKLAKTGAR